MTITSFNDFIEEYILKDKATSNMKIYHVLPTLFLSDIGIFIRDGPSQSDIGIVNLHPSKGKLWIVYINRCYFNSNGCPPPGNFPNI